MWKKSVIVALSLLTLVAPLPRSDAGQASFDVKDVLAKMKAAYIALDSYSDTGTVVDERAGFEDRSQFKVLYTKNPRNLYIEYKGIESLYKSGFRIPYSNRLVFWMQNGELQKWDQTGLHETYPSAGGGQVNALNNASYGSARAAAAGTLYKMAGKSGTAQVFTVAANERMRKASELAEHLRDHALFVAFAPVDAPKLAVAVIVENAPAGGSGFAAPIARRVLDVYLLTPEQLAEQDAKRKPVPALPSPGNTE